MKTQIPTTINAIGKQEIADFLAQNHKRGSNFDAHMINAWAADAENQLNMGNPPAIEIRSWDSVHGHTQTYTISDEGVDSEEFEIEE